jgi:large subunit ribosomal protein L29
MASKKYLELQSMTSDVIQGELTQAKSDLVRMKFDHGSKGLQDPKALGDLKKDIARLNTELRSREIKAMGAEELAGRSKMRLRRK